MWTYLWPKPQRRVVPSSLQLKLFDFFRHTAKIWANSANLPEFWPRLEFRASLFISYTTHSNFAVTWLSPCSPLCLIARVRSVLCKQLELSTGVLSGWDVLSRLIRGEVSALYTHSRTWGKTEEYKEKPTISKSKNQEQQQQYRWKWKTYPLVKTSKCLCKYTEAPSAIIY